MSQFFISTKIKKVASFIISKQVVFWFNSVKNVKQKTKKKKRIQFIIKEKKKKKMVYSYVVVGYLQIP